MNATSHRSPLNPNDLANLDSLLTQDEIAVRSSVRELCARRIDPYVAEWFEAGEIPDIRGLARSSARSACWGCTWRATAARG